MISFLLDLNFNCKPVDHFYMRLLQCFVAFLFKLWKPP